LNTDQRASDSSHGNLEQISPATRSSGRGRPDGMNCVGGEKSRKKGKKGKFFSSAHSRG